MQRITYSEEEKKKIRNNLIAVFGMENISEKRENLTNTTINNEYKKDLPSVILVIFYGLSYIFHKITR